MHRTVFKKAINDSIGKAGIKSGTKNLTHLQGSPRSSTYNNSLTSSPINSSSRNSFFTQSPSNSPRYSKSSANNNSPCNSSSRSSSRNSTPTNNNKNNNMNVNSGGHHNNGSSSRKMSTHSHNNHSSLLAVEGGGSLCGGGGGTKRMVRTFFGPDEVIVNNSGIAATSMNDGNSNKDSYLLGALAVMLFSISSVLSSNSNSNSGTTNCDGNHSSNNLITNSILNSEFFKSLTEINDSGVLGRFRIGDELGYGSYAKVCVGIDKFSGNQYALKIISKKGYMTKDAMLDEVEAMKKVGKHSNIVSLHDFFETKDNYILVMDMVSGGELFDKIIDDGLICEHTASKMLRGVTEAIQHMHSQGVCHLDIKPENLLMSSKSDKTATVKIADFGCALTSDPHKTDTVNKEKETDTVRGTSAYMPPEVIKDNIFSSSADMFSLGCVMYISLVGFHPFDPACVLDDREISEAIKDGLWCKDHPNWLNLSSSAQNLIIKMLEPNPAKRITAKEALSHPWLTAEYHNNNNHINNTNTNTNQPLPETHIALLRAFKVFQVLRLSLDALGFAASQAFQLFDRDNNGVICKKDIEDVFTSLEMEYKSEEIDIIFKEADLDGDVTYLTYEEFSNLFKKKIKHNGVGGDGVNVVSSYNTSSEERESIPISSSSPSSTSLPSSPSSSSSSSSSTTTAKSQHSQHITCPSIDDNILRTVFDTLDINNEGVIVGSEFSKVINEKISGKNNNNSNNNSKNVEFSGNKVGFEEFKRKISDKYVMQFSVPTQVAQI